MDRHRLLGTSVVLSATIKVSLEPEDIDAGTVVIHGLRVDTTTGEIKDSRFHPIEAEEK